MVSPESLIVSGPTIQLDDPAQGVEDPRRPLAAARLLSRRASEYLDLVRVAATNMVVIEHGVHILGVRKTAYTGGAGVVLFFLLSGFLITLAGYRRLSVRGRNSDLS